MTKFCRLTRCLVDLGLLICHRFLQFALHIADMFRITQRGSAENDPATTYSPYLTPKYRAATLFPLSEKMHFSSGSCITWPTFSVRATNNTVLVEITPSEQLKVVSDQLITEELHRINVCAELNSFKSFINQFISVMQPPVSLLMRTETLLWIPNIL